jgi:NAD(P)H-dependent flavin oxidoreductase YrpB (nitropropane dioxygenase family)
MPLQFMVTSEAVSRTHRYADKARNVAFNPVGQIVGEINAVEPTRDVIVRLVEEYVDAVEHLNSLQPEL